MPDATHAPGQTTRIGAKGEPSLLITTTSQYDWIYNDRGTGAPMDVSIFRPKPTDSGFFIVGDYAEPNYDNDPTTTTIVVKAVNDDPNAPLIKPPTRYVQVWNDKGSGGLHDGSIWHPVAPDGYVSLGAVGQGGYSAPSPRYACIRYDLAQAVPKSEVTNLIWQDHWGRAQMDVACWELPGVPNAFVAQDNYDPWNGTAYRLKGL